MGWLDNIKDKKAEEQAKLVLKAIPDKLKDKSLDDITALLNKAPELEAKVAELESQRQSDVTAVTTMKTEFESIKERLRVAEANNNRQPANQQEERVDFIDDGDKAFAQRVGPVTQLAVQNAAITARMLAQQTLDNADLTSEGKTMDGRLFRAFSQEIDQEAKKYQTINLTVDSWIGIYWLIKGRHADELANAETRKKKYNFLESGVTGAPPPPADKPKEGVESLTAEELDIASKMKVTPENYALRKKNMKFVNA